MNDKHSFNLHFPKGVVILLVAMIVIFLAIVAYSINRRMVFAVNVEETAAKSEFESYIDELHDQVPTISEPYIQTSVAKRINFEIAWATDVSRQMYSLTTTPMSIRTLIFPTAVPTTEVTTEIFDCYGIRRLQNFDELNCWHGFNDGQQLLVVMMQEKADPTQTWVYMEFAEQTQPMWLRIPVAEANPVKITNMNGFLLTMQAENSSLVYFFDVLARQFVTSLKERANTATPVPTINYPTPPPTFTPQNPYP